MVLSALHGKRGGLLDALRKKLRGDRARRRAAGADRAHRGGVPALRDAGRVALRVREGPRAACRGQRLRLGRAVGDGGRARVRAVGRGRVDGALARAPARAGARREPRADDAARGVGRGLHRPARRSGRAAHAPCRPARTGWWRWSTARTTRSSTRRTLDRRPQATVEKLVGGSARHRRGARRRPVPAHAKRRVHLGDDRDRRLVRALRPQRGAGPTCRGVVARASARRRATTSSARWRCSCPPTCPTRARAATCARLEALLEQVHLAMGGSVLTLFTNRRDMERLHAVLEPRLRAAGLDVIVQRRGTSRQAAARRVPRRREPVAVRAQELLGGVRRQGRHAALRRGAQAAVRPAHRPARARARAARRPRRVGPLRAARGRARAQAGGRPADPLEHRRGLPGGRATRACCA